jgi:hypothetical protein
MPGNHVVHLGQQNFEVFWLILGYAGPSLEKAPSRTEQVVVK